jgi:hypothetical protein
VDLSFAAVIAGGVLLVIGLVGDTLLNLPAAWAIAARGLGVGVIVFVALVDYL